MTPSLEVSVECFDDVSFSMDGSPIELLQAKHSFSPKTVGDMAKQFWNTIGIWTKRFIGHPAEIGKIQLTFVTTSRLGPHTAVSLLRPKDQGRDVAEAARRLAAAADKSKNTTTTWATDLFLAQTPDMREQILSMVEILDRSPNILDISNALATTLKRACRQEHMPAFIQRLEGWWFGIIIEALATSGGKLIPVALIDSKIDDLREEFGPERLPIDYIGIDPSAEAVGLLEKRSFVEQLKLIGLGPTGQKMAIVDYFRAREQRSRWARDGLLRQNELTNYGLQLKEHWQRHMGIAESRIQEGMSDPELATIGMDVFSTTTSRCVPIREVSEAYVSQGSYHMLSDERRIGWHPHYSQRLNSANHEKKDASGVE